MEHTFATSIAPAIETALGVLEDIKSRPADWDVARVKDAQIKIQKSLAKAQRQLQPRNDASWRRVQYALVAWIDEQCISLPWQGSEWWKNNSLEVATFRTKNSHNDFYVHAEEAIRKNDTDAIEAFFLCVVLGFRGVYIDLRSNNPEYAQRAKEFVNRFQLKTDLRDWLKRTSEFLPIGTSSSNLKVKSTEGFGAPPMNGRFDFVFGALFGILGLGLLLGYLSYHFGWLS
jgi:type VI secretion system protein ImpK